MLAPLTRLLRKSRLETMRLKGVERAISGHKTILLAVMEKDADRAAKAMRRHLSMAEEDLKTIGGLKYDQSH
jgi:DNA-binding GntR family transcriptional regulator